MPGPRLRLLPPRPPPTPPPKQPARRSSSRVPVPATPLREPPPPPWPPPPRRRWPLMAFPAWASTVISAPARGPSGTRGTMEAEERLLDPVETNSAETGHNHGVTTPAPNRDAEWWTTSDVAAYLGVQVATVSMYRKRGQMPEPDLTIGRTHVWRPERIVTWHQARPRPGTGGRPHTPAQSSDGQDDGHSDGSGGTAMDVHQDEDTRWIAHGERVLYDSPWVRLSLVDVELPDGQRSEHHKVWMPAAAMTALLNDEQTHVLLLWRHRFVPDLWNWELPGGLIDEGESPADTAAREIEEETGYRARALEHLVTFEPMVGMLTCPHHVYLGLGAEQIGRPSETTEMQRMEWVPLRELPKLIDAGLIRNSGTLVALLPLLAISGPDRPAR